MPQLMDLPAELRLRIYEFTVTSPRPVSVVGHTGLSKPDGLQNAENIRQVDHALRDDIVPLFWSCNIFTIFLAVDDEGLHIGRHFCSWLENYLGDAAKHVRHLELTVTARCVEGPRLTAYLWHRIAAPRCTSIIHVNLWKSPKDAVIVEESNDCSRKTRVSARFHEVLAGMPRSNRQPQVTKELLWDLFESCNVLSTVYQGYWSYAQAVKMYVTRVEV